MKITTAAASCILLATAVSAVPFVETRQAALERRSARRATRTPPTKSEAADASSVGPGGWGGLIAWGENDITEIEATVTVPTPSIPPGGDSSGTSYGGAAWVGIGAQSGGSLWQTGITWTIEGNTPSFTSWYEWVPAGSSSYSTDLSYQPGDQIYMKIVATSSTSGTAYLENLSTSQSVTKTLTGQASLGSTQGAQFLVEDFEVGSGSIPFAAYSPAVQFADCSFTDSNGSGQGLTGATVMNVGPSSAPFTSVNQISSSSFSVSYTGNAANS